LDLENLKILSCVVRNLWVVQRFLNLQSEAVRRVILTVGVFLLGGVELKDRLLATQVNKAPKIAAACQ
jgi:hypothetical protein